MVDDHPLMRKILVESLEREPDLTVCGQASEVPEALAMVGTLQPHLVLTDIHLKSSNGLDLIRSLRTRNPPIAVVATTMFDTDRIEHQARHAGAAGFVSKQEGPVKLVAAIRRALAPEEILSDPTV